MHTPFAALPQPTILPGQTASSLFPLDPEMIRIRGTGVKKEFEIGLPAPNWQPLEQVWDNVRKNAGVYSLTFRVPGDRANAEAITVVEESIEIAAHYNKTGQYVLVHIVGRKSPPPINVPNRLTAPYRLYKIDNNREDLKPQHGAVEYEVFDADLGRDKSLIVDGDCVRRGTINITMDTDLGVLRQLISQVLTIEYGGKIPIPQTIETLTHLKLCGDGIESRQTSKDNLQKVAGPSVLKLLVAYLSCNYWTVSAAHTGRMAEEYIASSLNRNWHKIPVAEQNTKPYDFEWQSAAAPSRASGGLRPPTIEVKSVKESRADDVQVSVPQARWMTSETSSAPALLCVCRWTVAPKKADRDNPKAWNFDVAFYELENVGKSNIDKLLLDYESYVPNVRIPAADLAKLTPEKCVSFGLVCASELEK